MAPIAALMYAAAALLVIFSVLFLPHPPEMNTTVMLALAAVGVVAAPGALDLARHWPGWFFQLSTAGRLGAARPLRLLRRRRRARPTRC